MSKEKPVLVQINCADGGSTGGIMRGIAQEAEKAGFESHMICAPKMPGRLKRDDVFYLGNMVECGIQRKWNKYTGRYGHGFPFATRQLLKKLDELQPDIVQLHNLHHQFFDIPALFGWLKTHPVKVVWTLHDCWALTGHCAHFMLNRCDKWQRGCGECPDLTHYPAIKRDTTAKLLEQKKSLYGRWDKLHLVAPSEWTAKQIHLSFLHNTPAQVIYNGINLQAFQPIKSDFRVRHGLQASFIVLGVSAMWTKEKGIEVFEALAKRLPSPFKVVLVGGEHGQVEQLGDNVLWIPATQNKNELAQIYTCADVLLNPTCEEVLGLVNIEALACGTPVVMFPTGGAPECIDESCGICLEEATVEAAEKALLALQRGEIHFEKSACIERAQKFPKEKCFREYVELYQKLLA